MKKFIITISLIFGLTVFAKEIPVEIKRKNINAEAVNIIPYSNIDTSLPFSSSDETMIKNGLVLTVDEDNAMTSVLNGQMLDYSQINAFISALNKQQKEKNLSSDEKKYLINGDAYEKMRYFSRKKLLDM